ncbi:hypothetical protein DdX_17116 [Ditylenchus destructor]|uniref:Uncharacterized protein n=1 Tax=Ditylenchus destructor TaxID=166010 RepID=A0AAD4MPJ7_9BILA|nr:hypothetical protein DdX_17116 [Ditylenchus destructor]
MHDTGYGVSPYPVTISGDPVVRLGQVRCHLKALRLCADHESDVRFEVCSHEVIHEVKFCPVRAAEGREAPLTRPANLG